MHFLLFALDSNLCASVLQPDLKKLRVAMDVAMVSSFLNLLSSLTVFYLVVLFAFRRFHVDAEGFYVLLVM